MKPTTTAAHASTTPEVLVQYSGAMQIVCAWCKRLNAGGIYVEATPAPWAPVSHGMCPDCYKRFLPTNGGLI